MRCPLAIFGGCAAKARRGGDLEHALPADAVAPADLGERLSRLYGADDLGVAAR